MRGVVLEVLVCGKRSFKQKDRSARLGLNALVSGSSRFFVCHSGSLSCGWRFRLILAGLLLVLFCTIIPRPVMAKKTASTKTMKATSTETRKENPLKAPDTSSPRSTLQSFLENMTLAYSKLLAGEPLDRVAIPYYRAKRCLNLSKLAPSVEKAVSVETAIKLKEVLDRVEIPPFGRVPGKEEVASKKLSRWNVPETDLTISEVEKGLRKGEFLFSPQTVARIDQFYEMSKDLPYRTTDTEEFYHIFLSRPGPLVPGRWIMNLPSWARAFYFGQPLWKWIAFSLIMLIASAAVFLSLQWGRRWNSRNPDPTWWLGSIVAASSLILVPYAADYLIDSAVMFTGKTTPVLNLLTTLVAFLGLGWLSIPLLRGFARHFVKFRAIGPDSEQAQLIHFCFSVLAIVAVVGVAIKCATILGLPAYSIVTGLGFGGIAVGLAAKDTVANFIGGLILILDRPFRIGDCVEIGNAQRGVVEHIGMRSTKIRTRDDILVTVPNSVIVNQQIFNESGLFPRLRVRVKLGVAYGSDLKAVESILLDAARQNALVMREPIPRVRFREFGESSLNLELLCWTEEPADRGKLIHELSCSIKEEFEKQGVVIPFPQRDVHFVNSRLDPGTSTDKDSSA